MTAYRINGGPPWDANDEAPPEAEIVHLARLRALGELTAAIVHEVSQPLAAIAIDGAACLRWLDRDEPRLDKARASIEAIVGQVQRSSDIVKRLRALSAKADLERVRLCLNTLVQDVVPLVRGELTCHDISLRLELAEDLAPVLGDPVQLQQVLINLVVNAIHSMQQVDDRQRELVIYSRREDAERVAIAVQDNGIGIGAGGPDRLFNAFFTTKRRGMGMGLAICRWIVEAHGGRIWAANNGAHGACFEFILPARASGGAERAAELCRC